MIAPGRFVFLLIVLVLALGSAVGLLLLGVGTSGSDFSAGEPRQEGRSGSEVRPDEILTEESYTQERRAESLSHGRDSSHDYDKRDPAPHAQDGSIDPGYHGGEPSAPDDEQHPSRPEKPRLYLVLDDAGFSLDHLRAFSAFRSVFTLAVLPNLPYSRSSVEMAQALGHETILHQPMEALNGEDPGPGAIYVSHSDRDVERVLTENLLRHPEAVGVNNHMGSRVTSDPRVIDRVLDVVESKGLFFLDSRTTNTSVVLEVAAEREQPVLARQVFLDHYRSRDAIDAQLDRALEIARETGFVVMIGHVTAEETAAVLLDRWKGIVDAGFRFVPLSYAFEVGDYYDATAGEAVCRSDGDAMNAHTGY